MNLRLDESRPHYCAGCGRQMRVVESNAGFDRKTGERIVERWMECPHFGRSWRNLWLGSIVHESTLIENCMTGRCFQ